MLRFLGYDLQLTVDTILAVERGPCLFTARDVDGLSWLVAQVGYEPSHLAWLSAPVSDRAAEAVLTGKACPVDAIRHSRTGTVELVTLERGRPARNRCLLCADLSDDLVQPIASPLIGAGRPKRRVRAASHRPIAGPSAAIFSVPDATVLIGAERRSVPQPGRIPASGSAA